MSQTPTHNVEGLIQTGIRFYQQGEYLHAETMIEKALRITPDNADAHNLLGVIKLAAGTPDQAVEHFTAAIRINTSYADYHYNLALTYIQLSEHQHAISALKTAIDLRPDYTEALNTLGAAYMGEQRWAEARQAIDAALKIDPNIGEAWVNSCGIMNKLELGEKAVAAGMRGMELCPDLIQAPYNLGKALAAQGKLDEASALFRQTLKMSPSYAEAHYSLSHNLLMQENFDHGWDEFEYRLQVDRRGIYKNKLVPFWNGEPLKGRLVHIMGEQAIGEQIMFSTMIEDIIQQGGQVIYECEKRLVPLYKRSFPEISVIELQNPVHIDLRSPDIDFRVCVGSLGRWFRRSVDSFKPSTQFLLPDPELVALLKEKYSKLGNGPTIGISWKSTSREFAGNKVMPLEFWRPILTLPDCNFVSLQYGDIREDCTLIKKEFNREIYIDRDISPLESLEQSAAQISAVDMVISISNATVHLAGALGTETWMILGDVPLWHWFVHRNDSLWYKSVRNFRKPHAGNWDTVVSGIMKELPGKIKKL